MVRGMTVPLALLLTLAMPAAADDQPCRADVARLCPDVQLGGGAMTECLRKNAAQLSAPCRERLETLREEFGGGSAAAAEAPSPMSACLRDAGMYCRSSGSDPEDVLACLKSHKSDLSGPCKDALTKAGGL